jgi:hypothetical protein
MIVNSVKPLDEIRAGNLIALPLQGRCREARTSVFLDPATFEPAPDQWALLSKLERFQPRRLEALLAGSDDIPVGPAAIVRDTTGGRERRLPAEISCTNRSSPSTSTCPSK